MNRTQRSGMRRPVVVGLAGWTSMISAGIVGTLIVGLIVLVAIEAGLQQRIPEEIPMWQVHVLFTAVGFGIMLIASLLAALSILALRGSNVCRYLLIAAWVALGAYFHLSDDLPWDGLFNLPLPLLPILVSVFAVPILLLLRGSFRWYRDQSMLRQQGRHGWLLRSETAVRGFGGMRGLILLIGNVAVIGMRLQQR